MYNPNLSPRINSGENISLVRNSKHPAAFFVTLPDSVWETAETIGSENDQINFLIPKITSAVANELGHSNFQWDFYGSDDDMLFVTLTTGKKSADTVPLSQIVADVRQEIVGDNQPTAASDGDTVLIDELIERASAEYSAAVAEALVNPNKCTLHIINYNKRVTVGTIQMSEIDGRMIVGNANNTGGYQLILTDHLGSPIIKRFSSKKYAMDLLVQK